MLLLVYYKLCQFVLHHVGRIANQLVGQDELSYDAKMHATDVFLPINCSTFLEFPIPNVLVL